MASLVALGLTAAVLVVHTLVAAVLARFFRIRLNTQWGWVVYSLALIPVVLTATTILAGAVIPPLFDGAPLLLATFVGLPMALGFTVDLLYVPAPDEYDLPEAN
ncbi:hypothetical protein [Candidatus Halobonum tyrrellensis]|uniref:DUF7991 domain-containing protein n=1 Tax=Candidatus Halobonum tyrrellensis G22 TaxID=1324957 RepID=V4HDM9_9EURY|nr:hypothetical protein [Candidatus Halobonum tyrrellensis]ESP88183.1 hypothetical protein K933_10245 [Candidatus Halobonum tyrrellensis G22]